MSIHDLITLVVEIILIPAIPIITAFLAKLFKAKTTEANTRTDNSILKQALDEASDAVCTAVTYTSQTFVDSLKAQGVFNKEAQVEALKTALDRAMMLLASDTKELLAGLYGSLNDWLTTKIEQAVKERK